MTRRRWVLLTAVAAGVALYYVGWVATPAGPRSHRVFDPDRLADLELDMYTISKDWTGATYDPAAVARAELAWWVARRIPGQNSPEQVGGLIADENALIYEVPRERVLDASILRARAGRLRDEGGEKADWDTVGRLLRESYRSLAAAVSRAASSPRSVP
jgi:hypothetical protein